MPEDFGCQILLKQQNRFHTLNKAGAISKIHCGMKVIYVSCPSAAMRVDEHTTQYVAVYQYSKYRSRYQEIAVRLLAQVMM